jgi:hypothetical protein
MLLTFYLRRYKSQKSPSLRNLNLKKQKSLRRKKQMLSQKEKMRMARKQLLNRQLLNV